MRPLTLFFCLLYKYRARSEVSHCWWGLIAGPKAPHKWWMHPSRLQEAWSTWEHCNTAPQVSQHLGIPSSSIADVSSRDIWPCIAMASAMRPWSWLSLTKRKQLVWQPTLKFGCLLCIMQLFWSTITGLSLHYALLFSPTECDTLFGENILGPNDAQCCLLLSPVQHIKSVS